LSGRAGIYRAIGDSAGCRALATAFYAHVEQDPILRPLFPSTFKCAIEEFSAFLVQFLGGEGEAAQKRWWLSLRESHERFSIGPRERDAWLGAMTATLADESVIADAAVRSELLGFFTHSSAHVVNKGRLPDSAKSPLSGELSVLWEEQVALDEVVGHIGSPDNGQRCIELLVSPAMQARFARSPAVHASVVALVARSKNPVLHEYVIDQLRRNPTLIHERYKNGRSLLYDAAAAGDGDLVERLLDMGAGNGAGDHTVLYGLANECSAPGASRIVRVLVQRSSARVNAAHGVKRCTALHMAARRGNVEIIGAVLDEGADIEARDSAGETALRRAVNCNKVEAARLLLARGADPHSIGSRALTPALAARSSEMKHLFRPKI
jgi:truncated hemoglobin YjbI/ankyrin repeat protein